MKNYKKLLFLALAAFGTAGVASAEEGSSSSMMENVYLTAGADYGWSTANRFEHKNSSDVLQGHEKGKSKAGAGGHVGVGYKFDMFRMEVEGVFLNNKLQDWGYTTAAGTLTAGTLSSKVHKWGVFLNAFYDHNLTEAVDLYLGFGLGALHTKMDFVNTTPTTKTTKDKKWSFAGQAKVGLMYHFNENFALNVGYRAILSAKTKFVVHNTSNTEMRMKSTRLPVNHGLEAGLTYSF